MMEWCDEKSKSLLEPDNSANEVEQPTRLETEKGERSERDQEESLTKPVISEVNIESVCTHRHEVEKLEHECQETEMTEKQIELEEIDKQKKELLQEKLELCEEKEKETEESGTKLEEEECIELTDEYRSSGVVVKAEPLSLMIKKSVIRMFFSHFRLYQDGQILILPTGNFTSCCYIVFNDESQANAAIRYVQENVRENNVIEVRIASEEEYIAALQQTITLSPEAAQFFGSTSNSSIRHAGEQASSVAATSSINSYNYNSSVHGSSSSSNNRNIVAEQNNFLIRLRGFPFDASERNIQAFLKEVDNVERIEMALFNDGTFSGEAFLEISTVKGVEQVFKLDKKIMGRRYVEVMPTSLEEKQITVNYLRRRDSTVKRLRRTNHPTTANVSGFVNTRGINSTNRSSISNNNNSSTLTFSNDSGIYNYQNRNAMTERINFSNTVTLPNPSTLTWSPPYPVEHHADWASTQAGNQETLFLQWLHYQNQNYNYIHNEGQQLMHNQQRWWPSSSNIFWPQGRVSYSSQPFALIDLNTATYSYTPSMYVTNAAYSYMYHSTVANAMGVNTRIHQPASIPRTTNEYSQYIVRVRGLPFTATENIIAAHFYDLLIYKEGIHIVQNSEGRSTGEAFIEIPSSEYVELALRHNGEYMGHRYLEIFRSSREQMREYGFMGGNTILPAPQLNESPLL